MPNKPKKKVSPRKLESLNVDEISLVDNPANEEPFLLVKRKEDETMGGEKTEPKTKSKESDASADKSAEETRRAFEKIKSDLDDRVTKEQFESFAISLAESLKDMNDRIAPAKD